MKIIPRVLCVLFAVLCAISLALTAAAGLAVYSLRKTVTPQSAASAAEAVDFASIRFPDGFGGFTTVPEQMNASFSAYGYSVTPEAFNSLCRELSFDKILGDYLAQFARWFFDYGPTPVFDPEEAARTVVGSMDPGALGMFRDPVSFVASVLARFLNAGDMKARLAALEPARDFLSFDAMLLIFSAALFSLVLLWVSLGRKFLPAFTIAGFSVALSGLALFLAPRILAPYKNRLLLSLSQSLPESTFDLVYLPVMKAVSRLGYNVLVVSLAAACLLSLAWFLTALMKRSRGQRRVYVPAPVPGEEDRG